MQKENYIPKDQRKKILLLCDDIRVHSGIATVARETVLNTSHHFNWVNIAAAINHPDVGKKLDKEQEKVKVLTDKAEKYRKRKNEYLWLIIALLLWIFRKPIMKLFV